MASFINFLAIADLKEYTIKMKSNIIRWYYASPDAMEATYKLKVAFLGVTVRTLCDKHADEFSVTNRIGPELPANVLKFFCLDNYKAACEACNKKTFNVINEIPKPTSIQKVS